MFGNHESIRQNDREITSRHGGVKTRVARRFPNKKVSKRSSVQNEVSERVWRTVRLRVRCLLTHNPSLADLLSVCPPGARSRRPGSTETTRCRRRRVQVYESGVCGSYRGRTAGSSAEPGRTTAALVSSIPGGGSPASPASSQLIGVGRSDWEQGGKKKNPGCSSVQKENAVIRTRVCVCVCV